MTNKILTLFMSTFLCLSASYAESEEPKFTVIPSLCGVNQYESRWVETVCLSNIKGTSLQAVVISYTDKSKEIFTIIEKKEKEMSLADLSLNADVSETIFITSNNTMVTGEDGSNHLNVQEFKFTQNDNMGNSDFGTLSGQGSKGTGFMASLRPVLPVQ